MADLSAECGPSICLTSVVRSRKGRVTNAIPSSVRVRSVTAHNDLIRMRHDNSAEWNGYRGMDSGGAGGAAGKICFGSESSQTCQAQAHRVTAAKHDYHDGVRVCVLLSVADSSA